MLNKELKNFLFDAAKGYDFCKSKYTGSTIKEMLESHYKNISYDKYLPEIERIKRLCKYKEGKREKIRFGDKEKFLNWYLKKWSENGSTTCAYCGVSEKDCAEFFTKNGFSRDGKRGLHLEVEQKNAKKGYNEENCELVCYVCNNAKSDFMELAEFEPVARTINTFWQKHLPSRQIPFPEENWKHWKQK